MKETNNTQPDNENLIIHDLVLSHGITFLKPNGERSKPITFTKVTSEEIKHLKIPVYKILIP